MHNIRARLQSGWHLAVFALSAIATVATAATPALESGRDPQVILQEAKAATGGKAWDALRTQHSRVSIVAEGRQSTAERWASLLTGRSRLRYDIGGDVGLIGYDGFALWTQDATGKPHTQTDAELNRLAINTAYRDRLAFWYPDRQPAKIEYVGRQGALGVDFDVVRITPEGGVPYEVWVSTVSHRIERMREPEPSAVRTEVYSDFRDVQGVKVPFVVQTSRGDPKLDERYAVELLEYNVPLDNVSFEPAK